VRDSTARRLSRFHAITYRATRGRIGARLVDNDMLLLHTTGRRSGRRHTVPLLYLRRNKDLVIIASWGGRERHPEWYLNLVADPAAAVTVNGNRRRVRARITAGDERTELWEAAVAAHDAYARYQAKTTRQIPVLVLES
jgi:deazaflavin-dependent oxidoreductase (nitroreductase family)